MGYTRIIQSGEVTELYQYQKEYVCPRKRDYLQNVRRAYGARYGDFIAPARSYRSIKRARQLFIRIVTANIQRENKPAFVTLTIERETPLEVGYVYLAEFWKSVKKQYACRYIGVPEWQERGVLHFHFIVWDLPRACTDNKTERSTRNFQRLWHRGFCDVRNASRSTGGLAGYLAKYLTVALGDSRLGNRRAYTCSRNIYRPTTAGSNALDGYLDELVPVDSLLERRTVYDTMWLGQCIYKKIIKTTQTKCKNLSFADALTELPRRETLTT